MKNLIASVSTHWFSYDSHGVLHTGVTDPGGVTSVRDDCEFEHGADIITKVEKHKAKLRHPSTDEPATPDLYNHDGDVVKLSEADCSGKRHTFEAAVAKITAEAL
jgi:hypothetical protein